jgi:hypothetical protein
VRVLVPLLEFNQFEAARKEQAKALEEEYHRRFWEKKFDVYMRLCCAAASLDLGNLIGTRIRQIALPIFRVL